MFKTFSRPSPAMVLAFAALFVALVGGAYAAKTAKKNSVSTKSIKAGAVTNPKLAADAVTGDKVADDTLTGAEIKEDTLGKVPSAATATTAETVSGTRVVKLSYLVDANTAAQPVLNAGGLTITATCAAGAQLALAATTAQNGAGIYSSAADMDNEDKVVTFSEELPDFATNDTIDLSDNGLADNDSYNYQVNYVAADGTVVDALFSVDEVNNSKCSVAGHALVG